MSQYRPSVDFAVILNYLRINKTQTKHALPSSLSVVADMEEFLGWKWSKLEDKEEKEELKRRQEDRNLREGEEWKGGDG